MITCKICNLPVFRELPLMCKSCDGNMCESCDENVCGDCIEKDGEEEMECKECKHCRCSKIQDGCYWCSLTDDDIRLSDNACKKFEEKEEEE